MMLIKYIGLLFFILLIQLSNIAISQELGNKCKIIDVDSSIYEEKLIGEYFNFSENFKGVKYLNNEWYNGEITLEKGSKVSNKHFNLHLATGQLIWFRDFDSKLIVLDKTTIKECKLFLNNGKQVQLFRKVEFRPFYLNETITTFLQVLSEGNLNLFAHRKIMLTNNLSETVRDDNYYLQKDSGKLILFKPNRWRLFSLLKDNDKILMKKIVRSNHLKIRKETDLIRALDLFNQEKRN